MWNWLLGEPEPVYPTLREGIVNLKNGNAFRGLIWQRKAGYLVLRNAKLLKSRSEAVDLVGETLVAEADVEFIQLTGGGT
jgi:hypothetical protein